MKKNDVFLIIIILLILVPVSVLFLLRETGDKVLIKIDGKVVDTLSLKADGQYKYETDHGYNIVEIKDSKVRVIEADCPGHDCVNKGFIKRNNESIICLPHRLEVSIVSSDEEFDIIVQ